MGKTCPKCGGIIYSGFDESKEYCPNCGRIDGRVSSSKSPEMAKKIEELQLQIEKLMSEYEKLTEVCETLPKCEIEDSCESCEVTEKTSIIENKIEDLENKIKEIEGEIPSWELVEVPEEQALKKFHEHDFEYLIKYGVTKFIDKKELKPYLKDFIELLLETYEIEMDAFYKYEEIYHEIKDDHPNDLIDAFAALLKIAEFAYHHFGDDGLLYLKDRMKGSNDIIDEFLKDPEQLKTPVCPKCGGSIELSGMGYRCSDCSKFFTFNEYLLLDKTENFTLDERKETHPSNKSYETEDTIFDILNTIIIILNLPKHYRHDATYFYKKILRNEEEVENQFSLMAFCIFILVRDENLPITIEEIADAFQKLDHPVTPKSILNDESRYKRHINI